MVELTPEEEHFYGNSPTSVLYDIFSETATRLSGKYVALSREAATEIERQQWWTKVLELRGIKRETDPDDRDALVGHVKQWQAELSRGVDLRLYR